ncbi:hypothetical protein [Streptomyces sp. NPDC002346]
MTLAQLAPHAALLAALTVLAVLCLREGYRGRHKPGHGELRPHSRHVGTAAQDTAAIAHQAIREGWTDPTEETHILRPNTPARTETTDDGRTVTVITMKRYCPDGHLVGDVTDAEVEAAISGTRLPDVRLDCTDCRTALTTEETDR